MKGAGGYGVYMLGSSKPVTFAEEDIRAILARPGVLEDISSAYDSPAKTVDAGVEEDRPPDLDHRWRRCQVVCRPRPDGHDNRPRPEYFLLRRLFGIDTGM